MYKLMLVDDEYMVRKKVISQIDWNQYGFEIVCEAENGNEAYDLFETYIPDVVITDIKMPFMDGLELSEKILNKYPLTKIIILTGFDEFEYAKKGLEMHIIKYILKPISSKELLNILKEVKMQIDQYIQERNDIKKLKDHYEKSYLLMKNKFLEDLVKGEYIYDDEQQWIDYYEVDLKAKVYIVSVVKIDDFYEQRKNIESNRTELKKIALLDLVAEIDEKNNLGTFFLMNNYVVIISKTDNNHIKEFVQQVIVKLEEVRQAIEKYHDFTVTIGIGNICRNLKEINSSWKGALKAYDYKIVLGKNQVIYINDLEKDENSLFEFDELLQKQVVRVLKVGSKEEFLEFTEELFNNIAKQNLLVNDFQIYLLELLTLIIKTAKEMNVDYREIGLSEGQIFNLINKFDQLDLIKNDLNYLGTTIIEIITESRKATTINVIDKAKIYVDENYMDCDLNIEQISEFLHYSPNYFSALFKKETGKAFMSYLLDIRLEASKDLLLSTDLLTSEVSEKVGFASSNYFSYCFKKQMNMSPSVFRKQNK